MKEIYEPLIDDVISERDMEELPVEVNYKFDNYITVSIKNIRNTKDCKTWFKKSVERYVQWQT